MGETTGMASFVTALTTGLDASALWGAVAPAAGLIIVLVLFALGKRVLNKNVKGASKGSGGKV